MRAVWTDSWISCAASVRFLANYAQEFREPDEIRIARRALSPEAFCSTRKRRIGSQRILRSARSSWFPRGAAVSGQAAAAANGCDAPILRIRGPRSGSRPFVVRRRRYSRNRLTPFRPVRRDGLAGHPLEDPPFRSVRSASFGVRAGGSERGCCADSAACVRPRKSALGPIRSPSGTGPSAAGRLVGDDCSRFVGRLRGEVVRVRAPGSPLAWVRSMRAVAGCQVRPARARPIQPGPAAFSCRSPPAPEASGALRSGARCAGSFTGARRT
jgi:hypothetical protein